MKKLCLAFVLIGLLFPSVGRADQLKQDIEKAVPSSNLFMNLSKDANSLYLTINNFRNLLTDYLNKSDSEFYKKNPQFATTKAKTNHIVQQMWTVNMIDTYREVTARMENATDKCTRKKQCMTAQEKYDLLNYLSAPIKTFNGTFDLRDFLHKNLSLCEHKPSIINITEAFLDDLDAAAFEKDIHSFRENVASYLDGLNSEFYKNNPQLATKEAQVNFISQMLVINVIDKYDDINTNLSDYDRTMLLRLLNAPLGKQKFILSDFWKQYGTRCGHHQSITSKVNAFMEEVEKAAK